MSNYHKLSMVGICSKCKTVVHRWISRKGDEFKSCSCKKCMNYYYIPDEEIVRNLPLINHVECK